MHLLYVTSALPFTSGETFIIPEIIELKRLGHRVTVVPIHPGRFVIHKDAMLLTDFTIVEPIVSLTILRAAFVEIIRAPMLSLQSALTLVKSRSLFVLLKNVAVFPKALWLARLARRECVDHIHAHFASTNSTAALIASLLSGVSWSFTAHRWDISENNLLDKKLEAAMFARAIDTRGGRELSAFATTQHYRVRVIHMGVAIHTSHLGRNREPGRPLQVLMGARFDERKGHRYALEAIAQLKNQGIAVSLHCAGEGPLEKKIWKYARELKLQHHVHFSGLIDHHEVIVQLREGRWDVALLPSIEIGTDYEGIPVFLIEAMAAGVPVIAASTGGIPELLDCEAGLIVPQQDSKAIAKALRSIASDRDLHRKLAQAGLRRVKEQFAVGSTASALLEEISSAHRREGFYDN
jgi:colanic acid/amylovoran biosynthesis glycosyltransferase